MQFQFKKQEYQTGAVESVAEVFRGQPLREPARYLRDPGKSDRAQASLFAPEEGRAGFANAELVLSDRQLLENLREVQARNNIRQSASLTRNLGRCSLDIEMETGTGKTYVYIKTIFELNRRYGWGKFIVVVPSVAIREGVKKSFEITAEHFMSYEKRARFFLYQSRSLGELDHFSADAGIQVMIINIQAFNARGADARRIYEELDDFGSRRPIDVIKQNRPILILDEPQKMGGDKTQAALREFNPLFCLNYSATHKQHHDLVYVLDALEAYHLRLVKKIEVKGFEIKNLRGTDRYLFLEEILLSPKKPPAARIELEIRYRKSINRETRLFGVGDDLYLASNRLEQYRGCRVSGIDPVGGVVRFQNGDTLARGVVCGDVSEDDLRRVQIRETILSHFEKERRNFELGVKTLSLFFIDEVAKYRVYDELGNEVNSLYGDIFEEEYARALEAALAQGDTAYTRYLRERCADPARAHAGYFSVDKHGRKVDGARRRGSDESDDASAYDLILRDKERLLSFEEPVRFLFSHSALREGWDNPNVFQICTLKHSDSSTQKRQEVGRGLRLAVDQDGERMDEERCGERVHEVNLLTVIASESYRQFVSELQKKIKEDLYDRPTKATEDYFLGKAVPLAGGGTAALDARQAKSVVRYLIKNDYIDEDDQVSALYREHARDDRLAPLPEALAPMAAGIHRLVRGIFDERALREMLSDGNHSKLLENPLNENFRHPDFQRMWGYLNRKYAFSVRFESGELIRRTIDAARERLEVARLQYTETVGRQKNAFDEHALARGDTFTDVRTHTKLLRGRETGGVRYDLIGKLSQGATLTRRTAAAILEGLDPDVFARYRENPEDFIAKLVRLAREQTAALTVERIDYRRTGGRYDEGVFHAKRPGDFSRAFLAGKHIQDYVFTDGSARRSVERRFAEELDGAREVLVYAKLPRGFSIPTPVGGYSPDWAVVFREGAVKRRFVLAETKGSMSEWQQRKIEQAKIACATRLYNVLFPGEIFYCVVEDYNSLLAAAGQL